MFYVAMALGNAGPSNIEYDWGQTRKYIYALITLYRFAGRLKFIDLDPDIMVRLKKLNDQIDAQVNHAYKQTDTFNRKELERWRKKYQMSKGISHEN